MPLFDPSKPILGYLPTIKLTWWTQTRWYVRADHDLTIDGQLYTAVPELEITLTEQHGGVEDKPSFIVVPLSLDPFDKMIVSEHAEIELTIGEADLTDLTTAPFVHLIGHVVRTKARFRGKTRLMRVEVWGRKAFMKDVSLGLKATDKCPLIFGDPLICRAIVATVQATVSTIAGTELNFSVLPNDTAKGVWPDGRYTRGFVQFEGLQLLTLQHEIGAKQFIMAKSPPQIVGHSWAGKVVTVFEGCDKTILACEAHGRQESFLGIGIKMPKYNPILEDQP